MSSDVTPETVRSKKGDDPFLISWYWVALTGFLYIGWLNLLYFSAHSGQDSLANISDFMADWLGSFLAAILIPMVIAYLARGRKGYRNGFNRRFFWGMVFMLMIQKTMISGDYDRQRARQVKAQYRGTNGN